MNPLIVTKSRYVLGHGRLSASGILTGHSEGTWAIFIIKVNWWPQSPNTGSADCPTDCKPPAGRVPCPGWFVTMAVMKLQPSGKSSSVFILLDCFFPLHSTQLELGRRECPHEKSCSSSKGQVSCWPGERERGLPAKLGPGKQLFSQSYSPQGEAHSSFLHSSREGGSFWGGHPREYSRHHEPWCEAAQGPPEGLFPFLSLRITEAQMTDMN